MNLFPLCIDLHGKTALIVGGGRIALLKAQRLLPFGARLVIIAPAFLPAFSELNGAECVERAYTDSDLDTYAPTIVVAATDDRTVNRTVAAECTRRNIPVNAVDDAEACTFQFPALITRGGMTVSVSTSGKSPTAAAMLKRTIERALPDDIESLLDGMETLKKALKAIEPNEETRAKLLREAWTRAETTGRVPSAEELCGTANVNRGFVSLIGGGCGKEDLITLRGMRRLAECDAVVYDALIAPALLEIPSERALRIPVGKRAGGVSAAQDDINATLAELAEKGMRVARLKGGDPYMFGRGGEEAEYLSAHGIAWEEIPGISSSIAIPAEYGIPVTHRGVSRSVHIVTAHTAKDELPQDLPQLAKLHGTLVFLMGLSRLSALSTSLIENGMSPDTPAAVLSGGNSPTPACARGTLSDIAARTEEAGVIAPAVIVVGQVAAMALDGDR